MTSTRSRLLSVSLFILAACTPNAAISPGGATPTPPLTGPSIDASAAAGCPVVETSGPLPSDTVTEIRIESTPTADLVTFVLGPEISSPLKPTGKLSAIEPPFSQSGSGEPVEVPGAHHVEIRLEGIMLADATGNPTYTGEYRFEPGLPALKAFVNVDSFEGYFTWIGGYDGFGCITLLPNPAPNTFVVSFGH